MTAPLLTIAGLTAGYGGTPALFGVDLSVPAGEALALVGRNGMGKTTTIRALMGLLPPSGGTLTFDGVALRGLKPHRIARLGLGHVPEGRQIFPPLTVEETLVATAAPGRSGLPLWTLERVYGLFPRLAERRRNYGNRLSGGEQQMLAIGRALMTNPRLLILDEATEGLAPLIRAEIWAVLSVLKVEGLSLIVVDKHVSALAGVCDQVAVMEKGRVVHTGAAADFAGDAGLVGRFLGV